MKGGVLMDTLIINAFGGPGAGKSTMCLGCTYLLRVKGINAEYVSEYAKDLAYDERFDILDDTMERQKIIFTEQKRRIDRLVGKVPVIFNDSPLVLSIVYANDKTKEFSEMILNEFNKYKNYNFFIKRNSGLYIQTGRKQSLIESMDKDHEIRLFLNNNNIPFFVMEQKDIIDVTEKITKMLQGQ